MTLLCRHPGRGNWRLIVIIINAPLDLFRFQPGQRFQLGEPPMALRIVKVQP